MQLHQLIRFTDPLHKELVENSVPVCIANARCVFISLYRKRRPTEKEIAFYYYINYSLTTKTYSHLNIRDIVIPMRSSSTTKMLASTAYILTNATHCSSRTPYTVNVKRGVNCTTLCSHSFRSLALLASNWFLSST